MSKLLIATAGSGKTTYLVNEALKLQTPVLLLTYTNANIESIRKKIIQINGCIPKNITVQTWFSFILEHGIKPYHNVLVTERVNGIEFSNKNITMKIKKENSRYYYLDKDMKVYSERASDFVVSVDIETSGAVGKRIGSYFTNIMIDEIQDLSGYDYELVKILCHHCTLTMVGDPNQKTYSTNNNRKNKGFSDIVDYIEKEKLPIMIDRNTLNTNHRSVPELCSFYSKLLKNVEIKSDFDCNTSHKGVYLIRSQDVELFIKHYPESVQLRWNKTRDVSLLAPVYTYGDSKGLEFDRVLLYPTDSICKWIDNIDFTLKSIPLRYFYVAATRARYTLVFVISENNMHLIHKHCSKSTDSDLQFKLYKLINSLTESPGSSNRVRSLDSFF